MIDSHPKPRFYSESTPAPRRRIGTICLVLLALTLNAENDTPPLPLWSLKPLPSLSTSSSAPYSVDFFIHKKLASAHLDSAPKANRQTLIRRASFDLLGLPPKPDQVEAFVHNPSPHAWASLIDQLLESPHYGERWGRHWLDVVRYADSGGYETDIYHRNAWKYRDYVIQSFNNDKPYDVFIHEQLAGDELWPGNLDLDPKRVYHPSPQQNRRLEARTGTGLFSLGTRIHESGLDAKRLRYETLTDWVDTVGSAFLGMTVECARCHDHKTDPITQVDYFRLQAVFAGSTIVEEPTLTAMELADREQHYPRLLAVDEARAAFRRFEQSVSGRELTAEEQSVRKEKLLAIAQAVLDVPEKAPGLPNTRFEALLGIPTRSVLGHEHPALVKPVHRLDRGELSRPREQLDAALPAALAHATQTDPNLPYPRGGRTALAQWLTQPQHPLTARVMVNRIWQRHFGTGIVASPNDFGRMGQSPTHPELLDWLAAKFVASGWSVKAMHRLIMTSDTYQRTSQFGPSDALVADPQNNLLWRMNRRRLEAEILWDNLHAVAGTLNRKQGGRPVVPPLAPDEIAALRDKWHWPVSSDPKEHTRRGLYILVRRNFPFPMFDIFDAPVNAVSCPARSDTTVAPQALWSLNNPSVIQQARNLAQHTLETTKGTHNDIIRHLWWTVLSRPPTEQELKEASQFIQNHHHAEPNQPAAIEDLCLTLFNLNEFSYID